jgi:hypothetical protein
MIGLARITKNRQKPSSRRRFGFFFFGFADEDGCEDGCEDGREGCVGGLGGGGGMLVRPASRESGGAGRLPLPADPAAFDGPVLSPRRRGSGDGSAAAATDADAVTVSSPRDNASHCARSASAARFPAAVFAPFVAGAVALDPGAGAHVAIAAVGSARIHRADASNQSACDTSDAPSREAAAAPPRMAASRASSSPTATARAPAPVLVGAVHRAHAARVSFASAASFPRALAPLSSSETTSGLSGFFLCLRRPVAVTEARQSTIRSPTSSPRAAAAARASS